MLNYCANRVIFHHTSIVSYVLTWEQQTMPTDVSFISLFKLFNLVSVNLFFCKYRWKRGTRNMGIFFKFVKIGNLAENRKNK